MKKIIVLVLMLGVLPGVVFAHLCNDVFKQAEDNLAVKVDIRDGQLRIGKSAKFRVYLLNTMDRTIDEIRLEVMTDDFDTKVTPSPEWRSFPFLRIRQKQYFEVELKRKSGTEAGKYKIDLRLFGGGRDFKTMNIDEALCVMKVPENDTAPKIDGNVSSAEWKNSLLCTSLYQYERSGLIRRYMENVPSEVQTRFRFSQHKDTLYGLIDFMKKTKKDIAKIYIATDYESEPIVIIADFQKKKAFIDGRKEIPLTMAVKNNKMELALPFNALQITHQRPFYVNVSRDAGKITTYWRGNSHSVMNPIVYATFML